eukprot:scaffold316809_cov25-Prasinocladus_malaysianus.AAC.1
MMNIMSCIELPVGHDRVKQALAGGEDVAELSQHGQDDDIKPPHLQPDVRNVQSVSKNPRPNHNHCHCEPRRHLRFASIVKK